MKAKLTVMVDQALIPTAKRYAKLHGISLSQLIETSLRDAIAASTPSFSQRWRGKFEPAGEDDDRYEVLAKKYLS